MTNEEILTEAKTVSDELLAKLSNIRIKLDKTKNKDVIEAIKEVFGQEYYSEYGEVYITYPMFVSCINLLRDLGTVLGEDKIQ
jgi:hypothetical protein